MDRTVAGYKIEDEIGRGGMGVVFRARARDGSVVAIKSLLRGDPDRVARFDRERRLLSLLGEGDGFVPLLDAGTAQGRPFIVMPFLEGGTLRDRLRTGISLEETLAIGRAVATALGKAHERGIVHRDLKPENVLFTREGKPLIADLGLARHFQEGAPGASQSVSISKSGQLLGTAGYAAPEQLLSSREAGPPADVFALAAILYECVDGRPAFDGDSALNVIEKIMGGAREPLEKGPRWLKDAIDRALSVDPNRRPANGAALAAALVEPKATSRTAAVVGGFAIGAALVAGVTLAVASAKGPPDGVSVIASTVPAPPPLPKVLPAWFQGLSPARRPTLPLPAGVRFGDAPFEYVNEQDGSILVFVPSTTWQMGANSGDAHEGPEHEVVSSPFFLGKYEVTNAQFARFVAATGHVTHAEKVGKSDVKDLGLKQTMSIAASWKNPWGDGTPAVPNHPVLHVSWDDAVAYVAWARLVLPTETQWERAARWDEEAGRGRTYPWGEVKPDKGGPLVANLYDVTALRKTPGGLGVVVGNLRNNGDYEDGVVRTARVGSFPDGASPVGALDMVGNAAEWVRDVYDKHAYRKAAREDPVAGEDATENRRVTRGGSWITEPRSARATRRANEARTRTADWLGFRVALGK